MPTGLAASDVIRAMMRAGFSRDEIYDLLAEAGMKGEQVLFLMDRVAADFHELGIEPRLSKIAAEVGKLFLETFESFKQAIFSRTDSLMLEQQMMKSEIEKLKQVVAGMKPRSQPTGSRRSKFSTNGRTSQRGWG